jgi:hypothetical protein
MIKTWLCFLAAASLCPAQNSPAQTAELTPAWTISKAIEDLVQQTQRLAPILDEVKPEDWIDKGAPAAYIEQRDSVRNEIGYLRQTATQLSKKPDSLPGALQVYLRLQALESMLDSLSQGVRRYQNPALADLMQAAISDNDVHRGRLKDYLVELAETREAEFRIMDEEAQRCRASQLRQRTPAKKK